MCGYPPAFVCVLVRFPGHGLLVGIKTRLYRVPHLKMYTI